MSDSMIGKAMLITYAGYGVQIDKFDDTDAGVILLFSVPKNSYRKNVDNIEMSDRHLATRVKQTLEDMGVVFADCRYKVRDEYWNEDMEKSAMKTAYKDMGYKDWQIK